MAGCCGLLTLLGLLVPLSAIALDVQGHRGARGVLPENTLAGFARALDLGVTTLELDCGVTRDGVVVIYHDRRLNPDITRAADGRWVAEPAPALWHMTYEELQRFDVGRIRPHSAYAERFPRQQPLEGARIPPLAALFALVRERANGSVRFNIETKLSPLAPAETAAPDVFARALLKVIREAALESRVTIQSFDWRTLQIVQKEAPAIATAYLTAERSAPRNISRGSSSRWTAGFEVSAYGSIPRAVKAAGGAIWSPAYAELTLELVREAQSLGLRVIPWTVNSTIDMRRLIDWGVDGIISDYPDVIVRLARAIAGYTDRSEARDGDREVAP